jgi:ribose 5-phosphate isomerase A
MAPSIVANRPEPSPAALDRVACAALELVEDGMRLGLGTGRAAEAFIRRLGERVAAGLRVEAVTTSDRSEQLAAEVGIVRRDLAALPELDLAFDGADEVTPELGLTKGRGGALVRERIVAHAARRFVVLVTPDKLVSRLGERFPTPVVVVPFAGPTAARELVAMGAAVASRRAASGEPFRTDDGALVLDAAFGPMDEPGRIADALRAIPGVIDHGLFLAMASLVLVGEADAVVRMVAPQR